MREVWGYVVATALVALCIGAALLYIRAGDRPSSPVWRGDEIRIGYSSEAPYAFRTPDGEVTGEAPEIAKAVLERSGIPHVHWVLLDFGKAIAALLDDRIDMIANGLFITPEREARVLFSLPYSRTLPGLLVRRGNPHDLHSYEDVAHRPDVTAAVLDGSVEQTALRRLGLPPERMFVVPDPVGGLAAVRSGRADCLALTAPTIAWFAREAGDDCAAAEPFHKTPGTRAGQSAFAFRPGDRALAQRVDAALREYIGTPQHLRRVAPFGFGPESLPAWSRK
jgi:polar amino acid transport system substrate-binding protein